LSGNFSKIYKQVIETITGELVNKAKFGAGRLAAYMVLIAAAAFLRAEYKNSLISLENRGRNENLQQILNLHRQQVEPHVTEAIPRIMKEQEKYFRIKYARSPGVLFIASHTGDDSGMYAPDIDTLIIPPTEATTAPDWKHQLDEIIRHELGHFWDDLRREKLGLPPPKTLGEKIILEGTGEYFRRGRFAQPFTYSWPQNDNITPEDIYDGGYFLVRPILNVDLIEGHQYLSRNPPAEEDLRNMRAYQRRAKDHILGK